MVLQIIENGEQISLKHFRPIKPLGSGDTGRFIVFLFFSLVLFSKYKLHTCPWYCHFQWFYNFLNGTCEYINALSMNWSLLRWKFKWAWDFIIHFTGILLRDWYDMLLAFSVHLVELEGTGQYFAMKAMDKGVMLNRNKVLSLIKKKLLIEASMFMIS